MTQDISRNQRFHGWLYEKFITHPHEGRCKCGIQINSTALYKENKHGSQLVDQILGKEHAKEWKKLLPEDNPLLQAHDSPKSTMLHAKVPEQAPFCFSNTGTAFAVMYCQHSNIDLKCHACQPPAASSSFPHHQFRPQGVGDWQHGWKHAFLMACDLWWVCAHNQKNLVYVCVYNCLL